MFRTLIIFIMSFNIFAKVSFSAIYSHMEKGDFEEVLKSVKQLRTRNNQELSTKYYLTGLAHSRLQEFGPAIKNYTKSLKLGNTAKDIFYEVGQAFYAENDLERARKAFIKSISKNFNIYQSYYYIAHCYQLDDSYKDAKKYYNLALNSKGAPLSIKQASLFQLAESLLSMSRLRMNVKLYVKKYVLKYMRQARDLDSKSSTANDIITRIKEIQREFKLDPDMMANGRILPKQKWSLWVSQVIDYDDNHTLANDLPGSFETQTPTYVSRTTGNFKYLFLHQKKITFRPGIQMVNEYYSERNNPDVFSADRYTIRPYLKTTYEITAYKKPASILLNFEYEYEEKDRDAIMEKLFNSNTTIFQTGMKFSFFNEGDTTIKLEYRNYTSYTDSLTYTSFSISGDQVYRWGNSIFLFLFQYQAKSYNTASSNDNNTLYFRTDYIRPNVYKKIGLNLSFSTITLGYLDAEKAALTGTELTITSSIKGIRSITPYSTVSLGYEFIKNISNSDDSNYNKNIFSLELNLNF